VVWAGETAAAENNATRIKARMKLSILMQSLIRRHVQRRQENSAERRDYHATLGIPNRSFKIVERPAQRTETLAAEGKI
jgi:hypothetical protein